MMRRRHEEKLIDGAAAGFPLTLRDRCAIL
jgi:hypothetical protein